MPRLLVAVDSSEGSRRAVAFVDRFFAGMDVEITAVNVARMPPDRVPPVPFGGVYAWPWPTAAETEEMGEAMEREEHAGEALVREQAPEHADVEVVFGEVVEAICRAAEDEDADLIVVGANDKGFLARLFAGSVTEELARTAPRPVLVVR